MQFLLAARTPQCLRVRSKTIALLDVQRSGRHQATPPMGCHTDPILTQCRAQRSQIEAGRSILQTSPPLIHHRRARCRRHRLSCRHLLRTPPMILLTKAMTSSIAFARCFQGPRPQSLWSVVSGLPPCRNYPLTTLVTGDLQESRPLSRGATPHSWKRVVAKGTIHKLLAGASAFLPLGSRREGTTAGSQSPDLPVLTTPRVFLCVPTSAVCRVLGGGRPAAGVAAVHGAQRAGKHLDATRSRHRVDRAVPAEGKTARLGHFLTTAQLPQPCRPRGRPRVRGAASTSF